MTAIRTAMQAARPALVRTATLVVLLLMVMGWFPETLHGAAALETGHSSATGGEPATGHALETRVSVEIGDPGAVLEAVLDNLRGGPLWGTYTFVVERPGRTTEYVMEMVSDGEQRGLIRVTAPPRDAGQAFLMDGDDLWVYNPRLGRSLRLPPSGRTGAFLGSDVSYNDMVGRDLEKDYTPSFASSEPAGSGGAAETGMAQTGTAETGTAQTGMAQTGTVETGTEATIVLELTPRQGAPTPYGRVLIGVDPAALTPRWVDYYDQRGQVVKHLTLSDYVEAAGRRLPLLMMVEDRTREGYRTVVRVSDVELDTAVPETCFTLQALERGCR